MSAYAVLVVWPNGEQEYLKRGIGGNPALFHSRKAAELQVNFMKIGMETECQSISVVKYKRPKNEEPTR
jgi:hypothetical protein